MKIVLAFVKLAVLFPAVVYSTETWTKFDMALGYKASRILNNVVLSFLRDPKTSLLKDEFDMVYGIVSPDSRFDYTSYDRSPLELEQSYISLITKIMKTPIMDHGTRFKTELEELSMRLLSKTYSNVGFQTGGNEDQGTEGGFNYKTRLTEMEQAQIVNLLITELCKITELANSYWDDELDELINVFLSNLGYKGRHVSKIHKNYLYDTSLELNKRQRMDFHRYFGHDIEKYQNFILDLKQQVKDFSSSPDKYGIDKVDFDTTFFKYFPHELYSFIDWFKLYGYLEKFKKDFIREIGLKKNKGISDTVSAIGFISGDVNSGDFVKIVRNRKIETKIYKVLRIKKKSNINPFDKNSSNKALLYDFETGERLKVESDMLIRTMGKACSHGNNKLEINKELSIIENNYLIRPLTSKNNVKGKCGDIMLSTIRSMLNDKSKLKNINLEHVISAIEILNYSLRFNEFPNGVDNDLEMPDEANVRGITTQNLMKCGSPLLILIVNKYNSLTGNFPDYQDCSLKSLNNNIDNCEPAYIKFDNFKGWQKAFQVTFSNAIPDLSFDDNSIAFWTSSIKSNRTNDSYVPQGFAKCDNKCLNDLMKNGGKQNNIVFGVLGQISWHLASDMLLLDKLVAKIYSLISIQTSSTKTYGASNVSSEIYNSLKYTVCDSECYTYEPDSVILGYLRWLENESNHDQRMPLINYYYLAFSIHSRFIEVLDTYKRLNPGKFSNRFTKSVLNKYYKLNSVYTRAEFIPPQNYPLASYVLQIVFFLSDYLESYKSKLFDRFPKNFNVLAKAAEPSAFSSVNKTKKILKVLRKYAVEFIFRFMTNNNNKRNGVLGYIKNKFMKLGGAKKLYLSVINDKANANLKYGPLAVVTVLSWALNGQELLPKLDQKQWKPYVTNLYSSNIPNYRKYFFYMILNNGKSPDQVAWDMISEKCKINNPKVVKRNLLNVLSSNNNILLVIDMANEIIKNCDNTNYDIKTSRLFTESNCHSLKLDAIKNIKLSNKKFSNVLKSIIKIPIRRDITKSMVEKCDWFYDTKFSKLVQDIMGANNDYSFNLRLIKKIKLHFGYIDFEYEYIPIDIFITGVYDYYSPLFDNIGYCNKPNGNENPKCQYETFIKGSKKQILLQQVYDGKIYVLKRPVQAKYKFGRIFLTEDTMDKLLSAGLELPECNGVCNVGDFRKVTIKKSSTDKFGNPVIKPHHVSEVTIQPLNAVYFNSFIFELYQVKDMVSGELITIDDVTQQKDVLVCADDDFYHNNIDIESIKHDENEGGLMKYPTFGYKFLKKHNIKHVLDKCEYFLVDILPNLPGNSTHAIIDPIEAGAKKFAQIIANMN